MRWPRSPSTLCSPRSIPDAPSGWRRSRQSSRGWRGGAGTLEADVRAAGATPATIALVDGRIVLGAAESELARLTEPGAWKIAERDLAPAGAARGAGGPTGPAPRPPPR